MLPRVELDAAALPFGPPAEAPDVQSIKLHSEVLAELVLEPSSDAAAAPVHLSATIIISHWDAGGVTSKEAEQTA